MNKGKVLYWSSTALVSLTVIASGFMYFISTQMIGEFKHFGFPDYFRMELGTAKIFGGIAILLPMISNRVKEWAYAGLGIAFISAMITHSAVGDSLGTILTPAPFLILLVISYLNKNKSGIK